LQPPLNTASPSLRLHGFNSAAFSYSCQSLDLQDFDLDDGKGDEFVRECRAAHPKLPIIAVSSHEAGNAALMKAGASAICSKMEFQRIEKIIEALNPNLG